MVRKAVLWQYRRTRTERSPMNLRLILWTLTMAYGGFLWAGRGAQSLNSISITGAVIGAVMGLLLAIMFTRRARRKRV
jgi:membrane associated rhomboid family serine protease